MKDLDPKIAGVALAIVIAVAVAVFVFRAGGAGGPAKELPHRSSAPSMKGMAPVPEGAAATPAPGR